jgi:hypothetical protein
MEFSPSNSVVKLCIQGIAAEERGEQQEARRIILQAWDESTDEFEKFLAAHFVARQQPSVPAKLEWSEAALRYALEVNDEATISALPALYSNIAKCYEELGDTESAKKNYELADPYGGVAADAGPFYHGTRADLNVGDFLTPGGGSNYKADLTMNHIYFTALASGAGLAAALAKGDGPERVYVVEPTGSFENDPNVTDKKFPGNLTRSYRSISPLKIVGEITDWRRQTAEQTQEWRQKLARSQGEIIN